MSEYEKLLREFGSPARQRMLYGSWIEESDQERKLRQLAGTYHNGCDAYDRQVCTGISPKTDEAIPVTPDEMRLINRHALTMRNTVIAEGWQLGFTPKQVEEAIRKYWNCEEDEIWQEQHQEDDPWWEHTYSEEDNEQPTIGTPEEAYAVELSLSDAEIERLREDVD